jgi:methionyl-tRNA formyltransferase
MQPWPTAYSFRHRSGQNPERLIVNRAAGRELSLTAGSSPGAVLATADAPSRLLVAAGQGTVEILELQPSGKRRMTAAEYLRGHPFLPGDRFGGPTG